MFKLPLFLLGHHLGDVLIDLLKSGVSVHPSVHKKFFFDFALIWFVDRLRPDMHTSMTSTRSKVKVMELVKLRKSHFSRSISSAVLA